MLDLFWGGFGALWVPLGSLLGSLEALLGGLRTQKHVKTQCFLMVLKRLFLGLWSSWWLSWAHLAPSLADLVPKWAPKWFPKVVQKVIKKLVKNDTKNDQKGSKKLGPKRVPKLKKSLWPQLVFQRLGLLKTLTWRCLKDSLKTVPKWFQNGSRLPKLLKIAPKIRPYKDL